MLSCGLASKGYGSGLIDSHIAAFLRFLRKKRCDGLRLPVPNGTLVAVSRALTLDPPRMIERLSISGNRGHGEYERRQRLYRAEELGAALEHVGFSVGGPAARPNANRARSVPPGAPFGSPGESVPSRTCRRASYAVTVPPLTHL